MSAAEQAFEAGGHKFAPGAFVIADANRAALEPSIKELGPVGVGRRRGAGRADARPRRAAHRLHPHLDQHAGRRLGAAGVRQLQGALHLLRRQPGAAGQPASRSTTSSSSRTPGGAAPALVYGGVQGNEPRPYKKTADDAAPRHPGFDRRHARRHRRTTGCRSCKVRAGRRRADHRRRRRRRSSRSST